MRGEQRWNSSSAAINSAMQPDLEKSSHAGFPAGVAVVPSSVRLAIDSAFKKMDRGIFLSTKPAGI